MSPVKPLAISCHSSHCGPTVTPAERRHAFTSRLIELPGIGGSCRACGANDLIDWERLHRRDPTDLTNVTAELRKELIRDNYWGEPLPARILRNAAKRTSDQLARSAALTLCGALRVGHVREGGQTYFAYNDKATIVHCAQHATATCCRECLETWLGIPRAQPLGDADLGYCAALVDLYVTTRIAQPELVLAEAA